MKKGILFFIILLIMTGCSKQIRTKTIELEEPQQVAEQSQPIPNLTINPEKIYSYEYCVFMGDGGEETTERATSWNLLSENSIIVPSFDAQNKVVTIKSSDYRNGFFKEVGEEDLKRGVTPIKVSPNGTYLLGEVERDEQRVIVIRNILNGEVQKIASVSLKQYPKDYFGVEAVWYEDSSKVVFGFEILSGIAYDTYNTEKNLIQVSNRMFQVDELRNMYIYDLSTKKSEVVPYNETIIYGNIFDNYELSVSSNGDILRYVPYSYSCSYIQYNGQEWKTTTLPITGYLNLKYWITDLGIYTQGYDGALFFYEFKRENEAVTWRILSESISHPIVDLEVSKDGNTIFIAEESETSYNLYDNNYEYYEYVKFDIYAYSLEHKKKEYLYKGANNVVGIMLHEDEKKLLVELRKSYSYSDNNTEILIFQF